MESKQRKSHARTIAHNTQLNRPRTQRPSLERR
jgi:hypothetical protein